MLKQKTGFALVTGFRKGDRQDKFLSCSSSAGQLYGDTWNILQLRFGPDHLYHFIS
ncbi:MAG: hypothetical protein IPJ37_17235 [Bacteroidales bacterium]|nr:hypothetical protein [Bacteroidales bacterium]